MDRPADVGELTELLREGRYLADRGLSTTLFLAVRLGRPIQSHAAALQEAKRGKGIALVVSFAAAQDLASGDPARLAGPLLQGSGGWHITTLGNDNAPAPGAWATPSQCHRLPPGPPCRGQRGSHIDPR